MVICSNQLATLPTIPAFTPQLEASFSAPAPPDPSPSSSLERSAALPTAEDRSSKSFLERAVNVVAQSTFNENVTEVDPLSEYNTLPSLIASRLDRLAEGCVGVVNVFTPLTSRDCRFSRIQAESTEKNRGYDMRVLSSVATRVAEMRAGSGCTDVSYKSNKGDRRVFLRRRRLHEEACTVRTLKFKPPHRLVPCAFVHRCSSRAGILCTQQSGEERELASSRATKWTQRADPTTTP